MISIVLEMPKGDGPCAWIKRSINDTEEKASGRFELIGALCAGEDFHEFKDASHEFSLDEARSFVDGKGFFGIKHHIQYCKNAVTGALDSLDSHGHHL